jgi:hypothetical protein
MGPCQALVVSLPPGAPHDAARFHIALPPDLTRATRSPAASCQPAWTFKALARQTNRPLIRGSRVAIRAYNRAMSDLSHTIDCAQACW